MTAAVVIGNNCTVGAGCTLYSCHIEDDVMIGDKSVVLEGARIEKGAHLAPGTVVPPGRLIPTKQLWGGNPCVFIKDLDIGEVWANYTKSYVHSSLGDAMKNEFTTWNSAYMQRESSMTDVDPDS
jgi:gamma-carbonic anhydrase